MKRGGRFPRAAFHVKRPCAWLQGRWNLPVVGAAGTSRRRGELDSTPSARFNSDKRSKGCRFGSEARRPGRLRRPPRRFPRAQLGSDGSQRAFRHVELGSDASRRRFRRVELGSDASRRRFRRVELGSDAPRRRFRRVELGSDTSRRRFRRVELGSDASTSAELSSAPTALGGASPRLSSARTPHRGALAELDPARNPKGGLARRPKPQSSFGSWARISGSCASSASSALRSSASPWVGT